MAPKYRRPGDVCCTVVVVSHALLAHRPPHTVTEETDKKLLHVRVTLKNDGARTKFVNDNNDDRSPCQLSVPRTVLSKVPGPRPVSV